MSDLLPPPQSDSIIWGGWAGPEQLQGPSRPAQTPAERVRAVQTAKDFESVLIRQLMDTMRQTIPKSEIFESGPGRQIQGIFWHYLARNVADNGGMGLWRQIYRQCTGESPCQSQTSKAESIK